MSELKAISSGEIYKIIEYEDCYRTDDLYYPKSEADKVIAEKDAEIRKLNFQMWSARYEAAEAECDAPRMARCRYMIDKFKEV